LPNHLVSLHCKAWALFLVNLNWLEVGLHLPNCLRGIVAMLRWQWHDTMIVDPDNLHLIEIDQRQDSSSEAVWQSISEGGER
jgi:hypothetical protein